ncbi:MAG TPA: discoidin domain-containing protein [Longimicrobiales bacterium]
MTGLGESVVLNRVRARVGSSAPTAVAVAAVVLLAACAGGGLEPREVSAPAAAPLVLVDSFDGTIAWTAAPASGVAMALSSDSGVAGGALRVDFDFQGAGGWAAFGRDVRLSLPENYEISFWLRGAAPVNTLELKLIDESGENVWWVNRPQFEFAGDWRRVTFRRRHVTFAWGPAGGGEIRDVRRIEFAITAGTGGRGSVWIDSLAVTPRDPVRPYDRLPVITASSGEATAAAMDADPSTAWRAQRGGEQSITLDFERMREYGGLIVHWDSTARAADYDVEISSDGSRWQTVRAVRGGAGARDYLFLPETESSLLRLRLLRGTGAYAIRELAVQPIEWAESRNTLFETIAADGPRGHYPKYLRRVQSYWTLVGVNGAEQEALMNEEGAVEVGKTSFSIEPFLYADGRLITWADAEIAQSLEDGYVPIPTVTWHAAGLRLDVTAWATGAPDLSLLWLRYRVTNLSDGVRSATLFLAIRPFQVNPSWQFLNTQGGAATVQRIRDAEMIRIDDRVVFPVTRPDTFGAATFDAGGVIRSLVRGHVPGRGKDVTDPFGHASGALAYRLSLPPGESQDIVLTAPLAPARLPDGEVDSHLTYRPDAAELAEREHERAIRNWRDELDTFELVLPAHAPPLGDLVRSNLAYVLLNRDGPAIQPGSRSYERSWIRDGSLTSAALLRLGHERTVRDFIEWFAPYQYADGKVPCCVDRTGAGAVPEHDSHGQLIYLIAEYFRFTGDTALVRERWDNVAAAVAYIDSLRHLRMTPVYRTADSIAYWGMVPQSISHEGYSAKPMHSYWDAFFVLKGLKDAVFLADVLGRHERGRFTRIRDEFRRDLHASLERSMAMHGIDYLPGSIELGDFDATSTTVGITPAGELTPLDQEMRSTFDRYWTHFVARRDDLIEWDAYTPYELRTVGAFVRLGERERAHEALDWFLEHVRPAGWNHWAEVVTRDRDEPRFIGDMPHGWVGSDFIRSVTDMLAYVRESDGALIVGAGVRPTWLAVGDSIRVRGLRTPYGTVGWTMRRTGAGVELTVESGMTAPTAGVELVNPLAAPVRTARVDGREVSVSGDGVLRLDRWPARVLLRY